MPSLQILHDTQNLFYRNPFGAVACGESIALRLRVSVDSGEALSLEGCCATVRQWEVDHELRIPMRVDASRSTPYTQYFDAIISVGEQPGLTWYYFIIELDTPSGCRVYKYGNNAQRLGGAGEASGWDITDESGEATSIPEPPSFQVTVYEKGSSVPDWFKRGVMYQIFVDRFHHGDRPLWEEAPKGTKALLHLDWDDTPFYIKDDIGFMERWQFFGGNLGGVRKKLPYLRSLGVTALYLNPIFEASSNHKYDTGDYHKIDAMFGGQEQFDALIEDAKACGVEVILDGVFSHTGADSLYFNNRGRYPKLGAYQSKDSVYYPWYRFIDHPNAYECWWGVHDLPNVEENNPDYTEFICGIPDGVIHTWLAKGIKGWRLDVADELPYEFIKRIRTTMQETDPDAVLIGEVWEDASNKVAYGQQRQYFCGDGLHSVMNYPLRISLLDFVLGRTDAHMLVANLMLIYENYPKENFYGNMNLLGSHDRVRLLTLLGEAPPEDTLSDSERRYYRLPDEARAFAMQRMFMLVLWQMASPGIPSIYYGDEAGLEGYSDPYNRAPFPWGREDKKMLKLYRRLGIMR